MVKILVVEDDAFFRDTVVSLLETRGYFVASAPGAQEATEIARQDNFDLLVSDIRLSGEADGVEGLAQVRLVQPAIRCILMTGFADAEAPLRAARLKADDYLLKPFKLQALVQSVQAVLDREVNPSQLLLRAHDGQKQALTWVFDQRLQEVEALRGECLDKYFLLVRSRRLECSQAYAFFCQWEALELEFLGQPGFSQLNGILAGFQGWLERLVQLATPPLVSSQSITPKRFELLFARINSGIIQPEQLRQAIRLLHDPKARRQSLHAHCTYHWLWSAELDQGDPFLGLTVKGYRLLRHRSVPSPQVRLYEAEAEDRPRRGDRVLCLPDSPDWHDLLDQELRSERASLLAPSYGHNFLLYQGHAFSLKGRLPRSGVSLVQAWKILRPVYLQVAVYHKEGKSSGSFSLRDIDSPPGQPCRLNHFSPAAYLESHQILRDAEGMVTDFHSAPEVLYQENPTPASDQWVLARLLFEVIHGGDYPDPSLRVHIRLLGQADSNRAFAPYIGSLGNLKQIFYRMAQAQPSLRFASLGEAIGAIDQALSGQ